MGVGAQGGPVPVFGVAGNQGLGPGQVGRAAQTYDNTAGANGDLTALVDIGEFQFANSAAGDLISPALRD